MSEELPPNHGRNAAYRAIVLQAILLGAFTGFFGVVYLTIVELATESIWGEDWGTEGWFSGSLWFIAVPVIAGGLIGLIYQVFKLPTRYPGFIEDLEEGEVDPQTTWGAIVISVITLVSGPSLGPEAPLGSAGGAAGTWLARRRNADQEGIRQLTFVGISGAFGGLLSTPIGGPLLAFELEHDQTHSYYFSNIVPGVVAGAVSFGIMWPLVGAPFQGLLSLPAGDFQSWMLLAGVGLGVVGAMAAVVVGKLMGGASQAMRPLDNLPVIRGLVGGLGVGIISFALPLTLFSGQAGLPIVIDDYQTLGVAMLIALALAKAASLGISIGGGFFGGPIFPMFFIGGSLGLAVHLLIPGIPVAIAVGSIMASLGAAVALLPLSMAVLVAIMTESGLEVFGVVIVASITAFAIRIAISRSQQGDMQKTAMGPADPHEFESN